MGSYCAGWGNPNPTGLCDPGFHCPEGQFRADPPSYRCPVGHYCPRGSENGIQCTSGFYQDELQQENCKVFVLYYSCNWAIPEIKCNPPCCDKCRFPRGPMHENLYHQYGYTIFFLKSPLTLKLVMSIKRGYVILLLPFRTKRNVGK